jgi:uncharacterized membrane protein
MAAFAYVLLPLTGVIAFLVGSSERVRFHGLQAIALGLVWGVAAYAASAIAAPLTIGVFAIGAIVWAGLIVTTLLGRDLTLPGGRVLRAIAGSVAPEAEER